MVNVINSSFHIVNAADFMAGVENDYEMYQYFLAKKDVIIDPKNIIVRIPTENMNKTLLQLIKFNKKNLHYTVTNIPAFVDFVDNKEVLLNYYDDHLPPTPSVIVIKLPKKGANNGQEK